MKGPTEKRPGDPGLGEFALFIFLIAIIVLGIVDMIGNIGGDNFHAAWDWVKDLIS